MLNSIICRLGIAVAVLGLALTLPAGPGLAQEKTADYWFNRAFQEQDIDRKIGYYQKSIELNHKDAEARNNLGILYKKKGMYAEAIKEYEAALTIPGYETPEYAYHNLGLLHRDRAMYEEAIGYFKQAVELNPKFTKAYNAMGLTYKALGRYEEAVLSFKKALEINPNYVQADYNLQNVWRLSEENTKTKRQAEALYDEGIKLLEQNYPQAAITKFQESLKLNPKHVGADEKLKTARKKIKFNKWSKQAEDMVAQGQWQKGLSSFEQALNYVTNEQERQHINLRQQEIKNQLKLNAQRAKTNKLYQEGLSSLNNEDWLQAISKFTKILMMEPNNKPAQEKSSLAKVNYYYGKGLELLNVQQWPEAEEKFNDVLRINPQHTKTLDKLKTIAEHKKQEKINLLFKQVKQAEKREDRQTAKQLYQQILGLHTDHEQANAGLESIEKQLTEKNAPKWDMILQYVSYPARLIGIIIIVVAGYLAFVKIIRPSQVIDHYLKYKEYDKARIIYEKILETDDSRRNVYPSLANTYIKLKRLEGVEHLIGFCRQKTELTEGAEKDLWRLTLGEIYQQQERLSDSRAEMELAYENQPQNEEIQQKLAKLYESILERQPDDTQVSAKLDELNAKLAAGDKEENKTALLRFKEEFQSGEDSALKLLKECFGHPKA